MHRVLERQIKRFLEIKPEEIPAAWATLLKAISDTYEHSDEDRALLSRSLDLSSNEFVEINKKLKSENEIIEEKVTERTHELEYERRKLDEVARHMATGAILVNATTGVDFVNAAALQFLNLAESPKAVEVLKNRFSEIPIKEYIERSLGGEAIDVPEADALNKIFSLSFVPLKNQAGNAGTLIWIQDITEQKLLEREKSQFIAIASHEMRTPLTVIRGNAELLADDPNVKSNVEVLTQIQSIIRAAVRLLGIVNDFLDVQHFQENKIALKIESVDVVKVLEETILDLSKLAHDKGLAIVFDAASLAPVAPIKLDKYRLQQILINVISNAIHYTEKGNITIAVDASSETLKVHFADTGIGMGPGEQNNLFKKFQTGRQFLHSKEYGSGLGLYISKFLARLMGGDLMLEKSVVGEGSTFCLSLPIQKVGI